MTEHDRLTISRILNATRAQTWYACSSPNMLRYWWGLPKGATMPYIEVDFRVGGSLHFRAEFESGEIVWAKAIYKEIVPLERIVAENHFSNEKSELLDSAELPASRITLTLSDAAAGTLLMVTHEGIGGSQTAEQYKRGWTESLERLALELVNQ